MTPNLNDQINCLSRQVTGFQEVIAGIQTDIEDIQEEIDDLEPGGGGGGGDDGFSLQEIRLTRLNNAIANYQFTGSGQASMMFYGDSVWDSFWSSEALLEFGRRYGIRGFWADEAIPLYGQGIIGDGAEAVTGEWTKAPHGMIYRMSGTGHNVRFVTSTNIAHDFAPNKFTLVYVTQPTAGVFKVQYQSDALNDNASYWTDVPGMTINVASGSMQLATVEIPFAVARTTNRIRCVWVSGTVELVGCLIENTNNTGMVMSFFARGGIDMSETALISPANLGVILNLSLIHI